MEGEAKDLVEAIGLSNVKNNREAVTEKNIKRPPPLPNPILKSPEIKRTFNLGTILAEAFFKVKEKETKDTFGKTALTPAEKAKQGIQKAEEQKKKPFKFPLLATLALGITAFATWLADFLGPVGEFISKTLPKLFKPMSKIAGGFFKAVKSGKLIANLTKMAGKIGAKLLKFGRFIPVIGSLFSFGFGIARWKKGEIMPAIFEFVSGIVNLLPGAGTAASMLIDGALLLYDLDKEQQEKEKLDPTGGSFSLWDKIRGYFLKSPGIQNILSLGKAIGAVFRGNWKEAGKHFLHSLPGIGSLLFWIDEAEDGHKGAQELFGKANDFFITVKDKVFNIFKNMVNGILSWLGDAASNVGEFLGDVGGGALSALKDIGGGALSLLPWVDDFMVRGDKVIPFNTKDDVIGMKEGGIIDNVFKSIDGSLQRADKKIDQQKGFLNKVLTGVGSIGNDIFSGASSLTKDFLGTDNIIVEIKTSNQHLGQLVQLTAQLVAGQGQTAAPIPNITIPQQNNDMSGSMGGPTYSDGRFDYTNSTYHMSPT